MLKLIQIAVFSLIASLAQAQVDEWWKDPNYCKGNVECIDVMNRMTPMCLRQPEPGSLKCLQGVKALADMKMKSGSTASTKIEHSWGFSGPPSYCKGNANCLDNVRRLRQTKECVGCSFVGIDVFAEDKDFNGANLKGADFSRAKLSSVSFSGSDLSGANFREARISGSKFTEAKIAGAKFIKVQIIETIFMKAELSGSEFANADISGADFSQANLSGVQFADAKVRRGKFAGSNLVDADLAETIGVLAAEIELAGQLCKTKTPFGERNDDCKK